MSTLSPLTVPVTDPVTTMESEISRFSTTSMSTLYVPDKLPPSTEIFPGMIL